MWFKKETPIICNPARYTFTETNEGFVAKRGEAHYKWSSPTMEGLVDKMMLMAWLQGKGQRLNK